MTARRTAPLLAALTVLAFGCGVEGLAFRVDDRVEIREPEDRARVSLPLRIRWTAEDLPTAPPGSGGDALYFAVLIDHRPMPPGKHLRALADEDCRRTPGCPDESWLRQRSIYLTADTSLLVGSLPQIPGETRDLHEVTIVLVDQEGVRHGESAFSVEFFIDEADEGRAHGS